LARITASNARWLAFHSNYIYRPLYDAAIFSLSWLFTLIQIICTSTIILYCCPSFACFSSKGITLSAFSPFSFDKPDYQHIPSCDLKLVYGGGRPGRQQYQFSALALEKYITAGHISCHGHTFKFVDHVDRLTHYPIAENLIQTNIPLSDIVPHISVKAALKIARLHHLAIGSHTPKSEICRAFEGHDCNYCKLYSTIFAVVDKIKDHNAEDQKDNEPYNEENRKHVDNVHVIDHFSVIKSQKT
jgi:hypothetical protein